MEAKPGSIANKPAASIKRILTVLLFPIIILNCKGDPELSTEELKWTDIYNTGDTLIFESSQGELDTTYIVRKETFYGERSSVDGYSESRPQWTVVWYKNKKLIYHPDGFRLVTLLKDSDKRAATLTVSYLYSSIIIDLESESSNYLQKDSTYLFPIDNPSAEQIKTLVWDQKKGIIRYDMYNGTQWKLVNMLRGK
jgi:hypothetical protein